MRTLYFEGAGWSDADSSKATVGNCRIRTAFHLDDGRPVYLEMTCYSPAGNNSDPVYLGNVDHCFYITDEIHNDDENKHSIYFRGERHGFPYDHDHILHVVNSLGASFDRIEVLPDLGGYRVFPSATRKGRDRYYYGDQFQPDWTLIRRADTVYDYFFKLEQQEGKRYPNFSLWRDEFVPTKLHLLRHLNKKNVHWVFDISTDNWLDTMTEEVLGRYGC